MNLLNEITTDTIAQHTGWTAYTISSNRPGAEPELVSAMRLRRLLAAALDVDGAAVLLHGSTVRYSAGPDVAEEFTATPHRADRPVCRWCLHWKPEHHPRRLDGETDHDLLARVHGLNITSCGSDFAPLTNDDRVICTRCSQYQAEHAGTGLLGRDFELTVACKSFTTDYEPEPDWDEEDEEDDDPKYQDCARCGHWRMEHEPLHQVVGACDDFEEEND